MSSKVIVMSLFLLSSIFSVSSYILESSKPAGFIVNSKSPVENILETRVRLGDVDFHEMSVLSSDGKVKNMIVDRMTDGKRLIYVSYDRKGEMRDCGITRSMSRISQFSEEFSQGGLSDILDNYQNEWMGRDHIRYIFKDDQDFKQLATRTDMEKVSTHCDNFIKEQQRKFESTANNHRRHKRQLIPGTNWCGSGNRADEFEDLGDLSSADVCCREHDMCPYFVMSFDTEYGLFNYRLHTLSHCDCDNAFRSCLTFANSTTSDFVGRLYFNMLSPGCFTFSLEKSCAERSWWGTCNREEMTYVAKYQETEEWKSGHSST